MLLFFGSSGKFIKVIRERRKLIESKNKMENRHSGLCNNSLLVISNYHPIATF